MLLVTWGTGKTSRSKVLGSPVHPSAEAVTEYVTVEVTFPIFANCCWMLAPQVVLQGVVPVTDPEGLITGSVQV